MATLTPPQSALSLPDMRKLLILSLLLLPLVLQGAAPTMPPDKELKALVFDSLFAFNKAVQDKSFAKFHAERLSPQFQKQFSVEKFTAIFQVFIDKNYDISNIAKSQPIFDVPPAFDSDGLLVLKGHYPTQPNKVTFKLTYAYEASAWKIMGINVQAAPSVENTGEVPTNSEVRKLAQDSLLLFNVAIQTKNFEKFYTKISQLWQKEITPDELLRIFRSFVEQNADIAGIAKEKPDFDEAPTVNSDGILVLKGSYPTQPNKVFFELKYVFEDESWKLVGINVQVKSGGDAPPKKGKDKKPKDSEEEEEEEEEPPAED